VAEVVDRMNQFDWTDGLRILQIFSHTELSAMDDAMMDELANDIVAAEAAPADRAETATAAIKIFFIDILVIPLEVL
jgi:enoyl-CoA hydratase/carnithine racemase